ncbi:MAG: hypothetical protein H6Q88_1306 [Anaeromyxobacteraceae bacterium]|nr:hypothetical protein [Anaeromyxobacteraceae bacterium]
MKRFLLLALLLPACHYLTPATAPSTREGDWAEARDGATRTAKLYDMLDDVAFATATWQSPEVRAARVERMAEWKGMLPAEKEALRAREAAEAAEGEDFLLAFFTDDRRANDLATDKGTWRVSLLVNGTEQALPAKVSLVKRDPTLQILYPYITDFETLYRVRFPKFPGSTPLSALPFQLRIAGALGSLQMSWVPPAKP